MIGRGANATKSWTDETRVLRSAENLWGASKLSHNPKLFIPNCLRPAASVLAKYAPDKSQAILRTYSNTYFSYIDDVDRIISFQELHSVELNVKHLRSVETESTRVGECARIILILTDSSADYVEPNIALISRDPVTERRGDTELIRNHVKWLASLSIGEAALISIPHSQNSTEKRAVAA